MSPGSVYLLTSQSKWGFAIELEFNWDNKKYNKSSKLFLKYLK